MGTTAAITGLAGITSGRHRQVFQTEGECDQAAHYLRPPAGLPRHRADGSFALTPPCGADPRHRWGRYAGC